MRPPNSHTNFFSSLKQVEKRLKSENPSPPPPPQESIYTSTQSLSPPIYIHLDQQPNTTSTLQDSEPRAFLSASPEFPPYHEHPSSSDGPDRPEPAAEVEDDEVDDIQRLMQLLGLSDWMEEGQERVGLGIKSVGGSCCCEGGFYSRIVRVKGPKCGKEVERLERWIKHFFNVGEEEEKREPLRLAHLLLGKAVFDSESGGGGGFEGLEFPSTIEEFLHNDPPPQ